MSVSSCLRGLRSLALSTTLGRVRPSIRQNLVRYCSTQEDEEKLSNIARVAREYTEVYGEKGPEFDTPKKDPNDRRVPVPVEVSIRYLKSQAYKNTYGTEPVWVPYRRNFRGQIPPFLTRKSCIKQGFINTGNPCPICRDEYLVVHYKNVELLKQFISTHHGSTHSLQKTNLCRYQYENLLSAIMQAKDLGLLTYDVPFREYNYEHYKPKKTEANKEQ